MTIIFIRPRGKNKVIQTVIDTADLERAMEIPGSWSACYCRRTRSYYINGRVNGYGEPLARFLYSEGIPKGMVVDHINRDTLDNRRSHNLRVITQSENIKKRQKNFIYQGRDNKVSLAI